MSQKERTIYLMKKVIEKYGDIEMILFCETEFYKLTSKVKSELVSKSNYNQNQNNNQKREK